MNTGKFSYRVKQNVIFWLTLIAVVLSKPALSVDASFPVSQVPLSVSNAVAPRVMLAMSRDHQLYIKAYTDYSDLDNDGILDTTYNNNVDYYGYFDSNKCYKYAGGLFEPTGLATGHQCSSQWSGNFLNWAAMTRMDIIRKVLYGGYRSTDTRNTQFPPSSSSASTILERTLIPFDVHAFAKVFSPGSADEMQKYTPYAATSISICNLTQGKDKELSKDIDTKDDPPLMRVANGSWPRWAAAKNTQCQWEKNSNTLPGEGDNLVNKGKEDGLNVRVKVCVDGLEETSCKSYTDKASSIITKKPTGLLQKYWESGKPVLFGLMTGSWGKNKSGGVLRKIPPDGTPKNDEINQNNGVFRDNGGIINTLDRFRISSYYFDNKDKSSKYKDCDTGKLSFNNGECVDWGNPLGEIYLETLRYLAGKGSPTLAFDTDDSSYVPAVLPPSKKSLPLDKKTWNDPINEDSWCARCSVVVISTGLNSFDTDELDNDLGVDAAAKTNEVGTLEGIGGNYLIGGNGSDNNKQCTEKTVSNLSDAQGICPEAPSLEGGYHIAGLAYYARTNDFRPEYEKNGVKIFTGEQSINTYSVALAESLPRFEIPVDSGTMTILPACLANSNKKATSADKDWRPCSMTDLIVENLNYDKSGKLVSGSFTVNWEDSSWGSNYDMDGIERLEFCVGSACKPSVSADRIKITASVIQAQSDQAMRFGYTITGSTEDGLDLPILRPGNSDFNVEDKLPDDVTAATDRVYNKGSSSAKLLENPLWYAAKYGGFDTIDPAKAQTPAEQSWDEDVNGIPDAFFKATNPALLESSLDEILSNVSSKSASSASVAANSTRLDTTAALYQAKFNPSRWNGQLLAFKIDTKDGIIAEEPSWDAGEKVTAQGFSARSIFSYNDSSNTGIDFIYENLSDAQKSLLTADQLNYIKGDQSKEKPAGTLRKRTGPNRLMGDIINSDPEFINSISQGRDNLPGVEGKDYLKYITSPAFVDRAPMLAVGANDGMLHVFNASLDKVDSGKELFAYVPSTIISNLPALTLPTYIAQGNHKYFVDGSPNVSDAYFDADGDGDREWRTALVGTTGAGGKGIFALDLTFLNPDDYKAKETFSANRVLWEINDQIAPAATDLTDDLASSPERYGFSNYLGVTLGQASIARMANGSFAAVFGNGYNSKNQTAVLYIVDIKTGKLIRSITTGVGDATSPSTINGLAPPLPVDANGDSIVDVMYAGDFLGNMWKFDVSDKDPDKWKVAFTSNNQPAPLFTAIYTPFSVLDPFDASKTLTSGSGLQPITAKPEFSQHPKGGNMVYFGTGKYFLEGDHILLKETDPVETFYGIWDECVNYAGGAGSCANVPISGGKSQLVKQTIDFEGIKSGFNVEVTSKNEVDFSKDKGWYMELYKGSGYFTAEKVISQAIILNGKVIFATISPDARGFCTFGGTSSLRLLDALTGKRPDRSAFDLTGDGKFNKDDMITINVDGVDTQFSISGIKSKVGMIDSPAVVVTDGATIKLVTSGSSGETEKYTIEKPGGGRLSWLQIR